MAIAKHVKIAADDPSLLPSDDEDDDFTLEDDADGAGSSGSDSDSDSDDGRPNKKNKTSHAEQPTESSMTKQDVDDLWASFNSEPDPYAASSASTTTATAATTATATTLTPHNDSAKPSISATKTSQPKTIKIQVEYKFVGETVMQEKEVPIDSPEAREWLAKQSQTPSTATSFKVDSTSSSTTSKLDSLFGADSESAAETSSVSAATSATTQPTTATTKPTTSCAPPRRPKSGGLGALAASLSSKPAKLNTLEKSKLDWGQFVTKEEGLQDDLNHNRKGGYLEKQDFLNRTEQAREEAWEKSKSTRR